ncbi:MAG: hypothetical protein AMK69_20920 [Nitrospira bacterium SG8_3]|nr:MAG: hypothetical protein AMK69_20920 [Nitrospira bacterium SG8_3]
MLVQNWMHENVVAVGPDDSMQDAIKLLKKHDIRRLPVIEKGKVVGIVTDRDLKRASASDATTLEIHELLYLISTIKVEEVMTRDPITVPLDYTVEETAEILLKNKISGVPVVDHEGRLRGIITQTDLFRTLITLTGLSKRGIQFAFQLEDRPGSIKETADIIRKYGGRVISILSHCGRVPKGYRKVYIRAYGIERSKLEQLTQTLKGSSDLLYLVDHRENRREIYLPEDSPLSYKAKAVV